MKRSFFSKLLALAIALSLSSCYTTVYCAVWNHAEVIDEAYWVEDTDNIELYRVGEKCYVKGFMGPARGGDKDTLSIGIYGLDGCDRMVFTPIKEKAKTVYIRINSTASNIKERARDAKKWKYRAAVDWDKPKPSECLTELPSNAVRMNEKMVICDNEISLLDGYESHRDAHRYYAYPLGAVILVAIDVPLTIIGNVIFIPCSAGIHTGVVICETAKSILKGSQKAPQMNEKSTQ